MENLVEKLGIDINSLYAEFQALGISAFIIGAIVSLLFAIHGYRMQKVCIALFAGLGAGTLSLNLLSNFITDANNIFIISIIIGIIVFIIIYFLYIRIISFAFAAAGGFVVYMFIAPELATKIVEASGSDFQYLDIIVKIILTAIAAVACGVLAKFVFKWCMIIGTSFIGAAGLMICMMNIVSFIAKKTIQINGILEFIIIVLIGIGCSIVQFKKNLHND